MVKIILDKRLKISYNTQMKKYERKPWNDSECKILSEHYYNSPLEELQAMLPGRAIQSIRGKVFTLKRKGYRFKYESKSKK